MSHRFSIAVLPTLVACSVAAATSCAQSDDDSSGRPPVSFAGQGGVGGAPDAAAGNGGSGGVATGGGGSGGSSLGSGGTGGGSGSGGGGGSGSGSGGGSGGGGGGAGSGGTGGASSSGGSGGSGGSVASGGSGGAISSGGAGGTGGVGGSGGTGGAGGGSSDGGLNCSGFVFCDDFEDGVADGWTKSGGTWSVLDDQGTKVYEGSNSEESWAGGSYTDQTVEARVKVLSFGSSSSDSYRAGIMARWSGASNFYTLQIRDTGILSIRKSTSVVTGCAQVASGVTPSEWFTLRLVVSGPPSNVSLEGSVNGQVKITCTQTSGLASGQAGVVTYGPGTTARFDDVRVKTP